MKYFEILKEFIEYEIFVAQELCHTHEEKLNCRALAFGALLFHSRIEEVPFEEIDKYWDSVRDKFFEKKA